jgi:hypothetical protein
LCWARRLWLAPAAKQLEEHAQRLFTEQRALAVFAGLRVAIACAASLPSAGKQLERGSADEPARLPLGLQQASGSWTQCRHQTAPPWRHCFGSGPLGSFLPATGWEIILVTSHLEQCNLVPAGIMLEVTVTSVSLPPFVSRRGLSNTNQRLSHAGCCWLDTHQHSMLPLLASCSCLSRFAVPVALGSFTVIRYPCQYFNEI